MASNSIEEICQEFFSSSPPPADLLEFERKTKEFLDRHKGIRPVVLVTVGGPE